MSDGFAFGGFEPANTTPVPDVLFDELLTALSGSELKVLLYIIRRTRGFKKDTDAISLTQFQKGISTKEGKVLDKGCGISDRKTIIQCLSSLETRGCIQRRKNRTAQGDSDTTVYQLRFREVVGNSNHPVLIGSGKFQPPLVGNSNHGSGENQPRVVGNSNPQETVIQETVIQEITYSDSALAPSLRTRPSSQEEETQQQPRAEQTSSRHSSLTDEVPSIGHPPLVPDNHQSAETAPASEASAPQVPATETAPPTPAKAKAEKPQRKPSAAKGKQSAEVQARINAILDCMDATMQKLINTPSFQFSRTKAAKTLIFETLIEGRAPGQEVTPRMLGRVMSKMYSIPKDTRSGFCWKDNMSVSAICHNFDKMWLLVCADDAARTPVQDELDEVEQRRKAEREEKRRQFWEKKEREAAEWERKRQDEAIERAARKAERAAAYTPPPNAAPVVPIVAKGV